MAGIGRKKPSEVNNDMSLDELKAQEQEISNKIRGLLSGRKDKNDLSREEKGELRLQYLRLSLTAKEIAMRSADSDEQEKYENMFKKASAKAEMYGSVIKTTTAKTTMDDIKGQEETKRVVASFAFMAKNDHLLQHYKMDGGLGLLMYGAPGTGKTMFAEAVASMMDLPLFIVTPADVFKSYVGESEQAVKQIFQEIDACPNGAILFIDECESIFSRRSSDAKDYKAAVTTELLQRMNGFGVNGAKRVMIGATNRPDQIDPAYLRYKRFSHMVHVTPPDMPAKRAIIESRLKGIELDGITVDEVAEMTKGERIVMTDIGEKVEVAGYYSAADICGAVEEACRLALEKLEETHSTQPIPLTREMFEKAFKKIGPSISKEVLDTYTNFRRGD
jgi:transitional endoplasmic reticulum ATPase